MILAWVQFSTPSIVDYDGYYHIKMAELIRLDGIPTHFPWLPYTILDEARFTDHHFFFHVLQVPFTYIGDLRLVAKVSAVFFASCMFAFVAWVLLQIVAFYLIFRKQYLSLLVLCMIFVWACNAFPTITILVGAGILTERICERKWDFRLILFSALGVLLGLVVNPYFPNNIAFLWNHIGPKIFAASYQTSVGSEWYAYSSWKLLQLAFVSLLSYGVAVAFTNREEWTSDKPRLFWILTATIYPASLIKITQVHRIFSSFRCACSCFLGPF